MRRIVWTCWFQGWERAPRLVRQCARSFEAMNPSWEVRRLDAQGARQIAPLEDYLDPKRRKLTAAALADVLRIHLLRGFGGVWADATVLCRRPLDDWLPAVTAPSGFFAFDRPAEDRPVASWFLAAEPGAPLVSAWAERVAGYWAHRTRVDEYFWFHRLFERLCEEEPWAAAAWGGTPKISADGPHSLQWSKAMFRPAGLRTSRVDWDAPVFKLRRDIPNWMIWRGCLLDRVLNQSAG